VTITSTGSEYQQLAGQDHFCDHHLLTWHGPCWGSAQARLFGASTAHGVI